MANVVKDTDNRGGIINQTTIRNYFVIKPKRWFKKTFRAKVYYQELEEKLNQQLSKKVQTFKENKKYIPDVFLELDNIKEKLRYITQPHLFYNQNINEVQNIEFHFFNDVLDKLGIEKKNLNLHIKYKDPKTYSELNENVSLLNQDIKKFKESIPNLDDRKEYKEKLSDEQYKLLIKEQGIDNRYGRFLDKFEKRFSLLQKRFILLTENAGQGKTNLVCDFVENVMLKKNLLGIMFTGNEFNNLHRDGIEKVIINSIYGFDNDINFIDFLNDIEYLCVKNNSTFTIVIDGLNENINIKQFSDELYSFVENILDKDFIRLIFTCRSEYFDNRFINFRNPSFSNVLDLQENYMDRYSRYRDELPEHLENRLIDSYLKFFKIKSSISPNIRYILSNNFLLLRMFSEVYGTKDNPNAPVEQVFSIYKDDLFTKYFDFKLEQINKKTDYTQTELKQLFTTILKFMIDSNTYLNISLDKVENIDSKLLEYVIGEDIFFRKDLVEDENNIFANSEVLNFTFDEFRDYLLTGYIVESDSIDISTYLDSISEYTTVKEGIERYLFYKSRKERYKEKLKFLENLEYYNSLFLKNIFSVNDKDIGISDIDKIKELFFKDTQFSNRIINRLMFRHYTKHYINLNIFTLNSIIESLTDEQYNEHISSKFKIPYDYYSRERRGEILELIQQLEDILNTRDFQNNYQLHNVFELMFLLLGVDDASSYRNPPYELEELLEKYIDKYPVEAQTILLKYENIHIQKIKVEIWKLINYYTDKQIDFDNEFYKIIFKRYIDLEDGVLKNNILSFLEKCYSKDNSWCDSEQHDFFKAIEEEREKTRDLFRKISTAELDISTIYGDFEI